jgi:O-6-methylguanine DNA methyltransferase
VPTSPFTSRVLSAVRRIPTGKVATYGDVAAVAGQPRAARAVGNIMRECRARDVPCHRVIAAAGKLGGYGGNLELKRSLLRAEGVLVSGNRIRDFKTRRWHPRPTPSARTRSRTRRRGTS